MFLPVMILLALSLVPVGLKICKIIDWKWRWVLSPLLILTGLGILFIVLTFALIPLCRRLWWKPAAQVLQPTPVQRYQVNRPSRVPAFIFLGCVMTTAVIYANEIKSFVKQGIQMMGK